MDTPTYRYVSDSFPPTARSISTGEELWPVDPIVESSWNARRGRRRAVQDAGIAAIAVFVGVLGGLAGSSDARGAMVAWGTMDDVSRPALHAVAAARGAEPPPPVMEAARAVEASSAPAATQAVIEVPMLIIVAGPMPAARVRRAPRSVVEDPYADSPPAPRAGALAYLSDPY